MTDVRMGLIGYGAWGSYHASAIAKAPGAELVAIAARSKETRQRAAEDHSSCSTYADYHELLARPDIDAVDVVVPNYLHFEIGTAVLEAGKHLMLEKPMALSLKECQGLIAASNRQRKLLAVGFELRLSELWGRVKEMIDEGKIGEPRYAVIELWRRPYRQGSGGWRYDKKQVGNWILEEPIHFFDLARWYFESTGTPKTVYATANSRQSDRPGLLDNFSAMMTFAGGGYAVISQTLAAFEHHQTVKITGTTGSLWAAWRGALDRDPTPSFSLHYHDGEKVEQLPLDKPAGEVFELEEELAAFVRSVRDGTPPKASGKDGAWAVSLCEAADRSIQSGEIVSLEGYNP